MGLLFDLVQAWMLCKYRLYVISVICMYSVFCNDCVVVCIGHELCVFRRNKYV